MTESETTDNHTGAESSVHGSDPFGGTAVRGPADGRPEDDTVREDEIHQNTSLPQDTSGEPQAPADGLVSGDDEDGLFPAPVTPAPHTGDDVIDSALGQLEESASSGSLDDQIEAGERVHRTLQGRLSDLGGE